jgi:hypothetical protein
LPKRKPGHQPGFFIGVDKGACGVEFKPHWANKNWPILSKNTKVIQYLHY